jgi:hypothetical protein
MITALIHQAIVWLSNFYTVYTDEKLKKYILSGNPKTITDIERLTRDWQRNQSAGVWL